jgi:hypothetical protein
VPSVLRICENWSTVPEYLELFVQLAYFFWTVFLPQIEPEKSITTAGAGFDFEL